MYARIESATDQVEIVRAMESSTAVLKSLHAEVGGVDGVEEVVDRLAGEMDTAEEVQVAVASVGAAAVEVDEAELDEEMEAMRVEKEGEAGEGKMEEEKERSEERLEVDMSKEAEREAEREADKVRERLKELDTVEGNQSTESKNADDRVELAGKEQ